MSVVTAEDPLHRSSSSSGGSRGSWLSEVVLPTVIVGVILIISLFAVIVLLMIRRHFGSPGHDVDGPYVVHHTPMDAGAQVPQEFFEGYRDVPFALLLLLTPLFCIKV